MNYLIIDLKNLKKCFFNALNSDSIDISSYEDADKEIILSFVRKFDTLDKTLVRKILEIEKE